jgi:RNA polymerase sigma-70 factor (ECF subfamily)
MEPSEGRNEITDALAALRAGEPDGMERLVPLVYDQLGRMARQHLAGESPGHTLSTTGLIHEAWLKLADQTRVAWVDRGHFFAVASMAMRRVLVDHARRYQAIRRGGPDRLQVPLELLETQDVGQLASSDRATVLIAVDDALRRLARLEERQARVVELRFFGGLSTGETAEVLGVTPRTVERDWHKARGWLYQELHDVV